MAFIVAWTDEDGIHHESCKDKSEAKRKLASLFGSRAGENYDPKELICYAEYEPKYPGDPEEDDGLLKRDRYHRIENMTLEDEGAILTEDEAYLERDCFGCRFDAAVIHVA